MSAAPVKKAAPPQWLTKLTMMKISGFAAVSFVLPSR
jgi:hypothetical protein